MMSTPPSDDERHRSDSSIENTDLPKVTTTETGQSLAATTTAAAETLIVQRSQLLPKVSFRFIFGITFVAAILAAMTRAAGARSSGAGISGAGISGTEGLGFFASLTFGVLTAVGFLAFVIAVMVFFFLLGWVVALMTHRHEPEETVGDENLPPQWVAPRDPVL